MGDDGGYEYVDWAADTGSGVDGVPGRYASPGCLGEDVGMLKASCVDDMAVRELRLFLPGEKRLVNQLMDTATRWLAVKERRSAWLRQL